VSGRAAPTAATGCTVELAGVPGSGKSRLARTLAAALQERGVAVGQPQRRLSPDVPRGLRLSRKALMCLSAAAAAPLHTARLAGGLARSAQDAPADLAARLVQLLVAEAVARRAAGRGQVSIVDEGVVQALWSVGLRGDVAPVLTVLDGGAAAPRADLLVVLRVPAELALARLSARDSMHSRVQLVPEPARFTEMERGIRLLDRLVEWWSGPPGAARATCVLTHAEEDSDERDRLVERICRAAGRS
jgi:thymidylate kinase